jgi:RNA-directed DNA polymerase
VLAYFDCRQHKRNTLARCAFERDLEAQPRRLYEQTDRRRLPAGPSICFVVTRPKPREVWAADFRDRVVHHLLYNKIGPRFERTFIADSCACIKGRGTLYAAERLEAKIRSITQNWSRPAFYLKCDIANFFVSIDKRRLAQLLAAKVTGAVLARPRDARPLPRPAAARGGAKLARALALIPPHKSLWAQPAAHGPADRQPVEPVLRQRLLNELDQHAKHALRARHYVRYVDDFVLLDESPQWLNYARAEIEAFLPASSGCSSTRARPSSSRSAAASTSSAR